MANPITASDWPFDERLHTLWRIAVECRHKDPRTTVMAISEANRMLLVSPEAKSHKDQGERPPVEPDLYSAKKLAQRWKCSERHVRNMIDEKAIPTFRVGKLIRVKIADIIEYERRADRNAVSNLPTAQIADDEDNTATTPKKRRPRLDTPEMRARWKRMDEKRSRDG